MYNTISPYVSIVVPIYNVEKYVYECMESLVNQTLGNIEIICIDDGSTDGSAEIVKKFADTDKRIRIISQNNMGVSSARNIGLKKAKGEYIHFLDSDDYMNKDAYEKLFNIAKREQTDIIYFGTTAFFENRKIEEENSDKKTLYIRKGEYPRAISGIELLGLFLQNQDYIVNTGLQFIRRDFLIDNELLFYNGIIHEDNLFTFKTIVRAKSSLCIKEKFHNRRVRENSITTVKANEHNCFGFLVTAIEMIKDVEENENEKKIVSEGWKVISSILNYCALIYHSLNNNEQERFRKMCNPLQFLFFESYILPRHDLITVKEESERIENSYSFKVGCLITFPARKLRKAVKKLINGQMFISFMSL